MKYVAILAIASFSFFSCKSEKKVKTESNPTNTDSQQVTTNTPDNQSTDPKSNDTDSIECNPVMLDMERTTGVSDPFTIKDARMKGKKLEIDVEYGGGCGGAEFDLVWNGMLMKSMPPKANVVLILSDKDYCKALVTKTLCFDLSSIYTNECVILLKDFRGHLVMK